MTNFKIRGNTIISESCNTAHTFEIVNKIPLVFFIWNIGENMGHPEYIPLCEDLYPEAIALTLKANLGVRISDIFKLRFCNIIKDGDRFRLDITEQKTDKARTFTVPAEIREFIDQYRINNHMSIQQKQLETALQNHIKLL